MKKKSIISLAAVKQQPSLTSPGSVYLVSCHKPEADWTRKTPTTEGEEKEATLENQIK